MGYQTVTCIMTSFDPQGAVRKYGRLSILATAWLLVKYQIYVFRFNFGPSNLWQGAIFVDCVCFVGSDLLYERSVI